MTSKLRYWWVWLKVRLFWFVSFLFLAFSIYRGVRG